MVAAEPGLKLKLTIVGVDVVHSLIQGQVEDQVAAQGMAEAMIPATEEVADPVTKKRLLI